MFQNFFKFIPTALLLFVVMAPQSLVAQDIPVINSDAERIIKQYEQGFLTNPTFAEKQIISDYLANWQTPSNYMQKQNPAPEATFHLQEDFTAPTPLLVDDFDFTGLLTANGWDKHSGTGNPISTTTGLTYTGYPGSGVGNAAFVSGYSSSSEDDNRGFTEQNTNGDVVYFSSLINVTDTAANKTGTYFFHIGNRNDSSSFTSFAARVFAKIESGVVYFGLSNTSTATYGTTAFAKNTTYMLIVKYTINTAGDDEAKLWVVASGVPADEVAAGTPEVTNTTTSGQDVIDAVGLRQSNTSQAEVVIDGIRIGTAWAQLFPGAPAGWTNVDNGVTGQVWEFNNPGGRTITGNFDTDFAILDSDNYGSGGSQNASLTTAAIDLSTAGSLITLGFDQQHRSLGSVCLVQVSSDNVTWATLDSIVTDKGYPNPAVYSEYDISSYSGQSTVYVRWTYTGSWDWWWAIDNVVVYEPDAQPLPAGLVNPPDAGIDISPFTTLDWAAGGGAAPTGYKINFGTDNPPTNIENGTDLGLVTQYTPASALSYGTTYYWEIIPYNGAGDATGTSVWSFTVLSPIAQPYEEDFNDTTANGWLTTGWSLYIGHGVSGSVSIGENYWSAAPQSWVSAPLVGPLTATSQMEFDYRIVNFSGYPGTATVLDADYFDVQVSTDGGTTFTTEFTIDSSNHVTSTSYATLIVPLGGTYSGQSVIVRVDGYWVTGDYYFDLDDFKIRETPLGAPNPAVNVNPLNGATLVSILTTLDWSSGGGAAETGYKINFGTDNPPTNIENNTDLGLVTQYTPASALAYATTYYWEIIPYNGSGDATGTVVWSFTTQPDPTILVFPWNDDLETPGAPGTPLGWTQDVADDFDWTFDAGGTPSSATGPSVDHNPGTALGTYGFTESSANYGATANVWTPPFDVSGLTTPVFSFWYHMYGATMGTLSVDYSQDDGATWTNGWTLSGDQGDVWYNASFTLPTDADYVRFSGLTGTSFTSDMAFDDVSIFDNVNPPNCAVNVSPLDGAIDVYAGTDLNWADGGGGTDGYKLFFGTDNPPTNIENGTDLGNVTTYDPASDLSYVTTYYWQVIAYNVNGDATGCSVWSFTTQSDPTITTFPWVETFEDDSPSRPAWIQIQEAGSGLWTYDVGSSGGLITTAYEDSLNARFVSLSGTNSPITKLVSPPLDLTSVLAPRVTFAYGQEQWAGDQNELKVYSRISSSDPWVELAHFTVDVPAWTETSVFLPNGSATYQIAFEGINNWGRANVLDSVHVGQGPPNDVATVSIDMAASYTPGSVTPLATVGNFGSAAQTFDVTMTIGAYTSTKTVTTLASGATQQVTFDGWTATLGNHLVDVTTHLTPDADSSNNTKQLDVVVANGTWSSGAPIPGTQYVGSGVALNGFVYSIGGNTASGLNEECYKYEVATDTWTQIASLPVGKVTGATATDGVYVYAIGGSSAASGAYTDTCYQYNVALDTWTQIASLPAAVGWPQAVGYNGTHIYVAGGHDGVNPLATVYVYDVIAGTWATATSMPGIRFGGAFSVTGNMLVYIAGIAVDFTDSVYVGTIDGVDPTLITWVNAMSMFPGQKDGYSRYGGDITELSVVDKRHVPVLPEAVYPPGGTFKFAAAGPWGTDGIIVAGGNDGVGGFWTAVNHCYVYNPTTDTWGAELPLPIAVLQGAGGTVNSGGIWKFVVATGYTGSVITDAVQIYTVDMGGSSTFALTVNVTDGWNMVSVPGTNPAGMGVTDWWSGKDPAAGVFKYAGGYVEVFTTAPTEGYWMKNSGAQVYSYPAINIVTHNSIAAAAGWNMIGGYELTVPTASLVTTPPNLINTPVFEYSGGYQNATNIVPGYGYWVKMDAAGTIDSPPLAKGTQPVELFPEDWGKILLTDATGINYTLYAVTGEVNLDKYELPPMPPSGMFDIRFSSGRIAEDINSSIQTIDMSGVTYPLTVRVEGMDIRLTDETGKTINVNLKSGEDVVISDATIQKLMVSGELIPAVYALEQNYPNPFNPSTTIEFSLPEDVSNVKLSIYNALGERVAEIVNTSLVAGKYQYQWNAKNVATGMYIYELRTDKFVSVKKMLLLK